MNFHHARPRVPISQGDLLCLGVDVCAYIRNVTIKGESCYATHHADGRLIAVYGNRDDAFASIILKGLQNVTLH